MSLNLHLFHVKQSLFNMNFCNQWLNGHKQPSRFNAMPIRYRRSICNVIMFWVWVHIRQMKGTVYCLLQNVAWSRYPTSPGSTRTWTPSVVWWCRVRLARCSTLGSVNVNRTSTTYCSNHHPLVKRRNGALLSGYVATVECGETENLILLMWFSFVIGAN